VDRLHNLLMREKEEQDSLEARARDGIASSTNESLGMAFADSPLGALIHRQHMEMVARQMRGMNNRAGSGTTAVLRVSRPGDTEEQSGSMNDDEQTDSEDEEWTQVPHRQVVDNPIGALRISANSHTMQSRPSQISRLANSAARNPTDMTQMHENGIRHVPLEENESTLTTGGSVRPYRVISNPHHHVETRRIMMTPTPDTFSRSEEAQSRMPNQPIRRTYILRSVGEINRISAVPVTQLASVSIQSNRALSQPDDTS